MSRPTATRGAGVLRAQFSSAFASDSGCWNLLFPRGEWHGANLAPIGGRIVIDDAMLDEMVANWADAGKPPLPIRKTHRHLDDDVPAVDRLELERAYGFLTDLRITAQGLEALTEWSPAGQAEVKSGAFAFWSPEWQPKHKDRRTGAARGWWLSGTALTNDPFFNEMPPVAASADDAETTDTNPSKEKHMTPELKKRMKAALKLADECGDEEMTAACEKMAAGYVAAAAASDDKLTAAMTATVEPLKAQLSAAMAESAGLKAKLEDKEIESLLASAKADGRAIEPLKEFIIEAFRSGGVEKALKLIASAPVVPLAPIGVGAGNQDTSATDARAKFFALIETKLKAGASSVEAYRTVTAEHRELAESVFTSTSSTR